MEPVVFVGAGPGDPELITVKGARLLAEADLVLYAGSLVPEALLAHCRPEAETISSAGMDLNEQVALMTEAVQAGKRVVRLHTGDPSLYGAIQEQRQFLDEAEIPSRVVPGVTAGLAAAAAYGAELTLPEISQTIIFTRMAGRTPVPEKEALVDLAKHRASLCLYLSAGVIDQAQEALAQGYGAATPALIAYRIGWPEERLIKTTVGRLAETMQSEGVTRQAVVLVGDALAKARLTAFSKLYDPEFDHGFRAASPGKD